MRGCSQGKVSMLTGSGMRMQPPRICILGLFDAKFQVSMLTMEKPSRQFDCVFPVKSDTCIRAMRIVPQS